MVLTSFGAFSFSFLFFLFFLLSCLTGVTTILNELIHPENIKAHLIVNSHNLVSPYPFQRKTMEYNVNFFYEQSTKKDSY